MGAYWYVWLGCCDIDATADIAAAAEAVQLETDPPRNKHMSRHGRWVYLRLQLQRWLLSQRNCQLYCGKAGRSFVVQE